MTTIIGGRKWTYYDGGQYPCTCFFCQVKIDTVQPRWHSPKPTSLYACNRCFNDDEIDSRLYPETGQQAFEKASEVPVEAKTSFTLGDDTPKGDYAPTAREMAISKAHEENMEASEALRVEIRNAWQVIERLCNILEARK